MGKNLNSFNLAPVARDAALVGELIEKWGSELDDSLSSVNDLASGFQSVVQEISKGNIGLASTKKTFNSFLKLFIFGFALAFFVSCDKEFNEIGADFVDNDHYNFATQKYDVIAYNQSSGPVQTNNLPINALGYYNNKVFGTTKASFVTQLELASVNPTFINPSTITIDSVYLHVPYFSHKKDELDADGYNIYQLDSIYGAGKIKLEVFRSNYFLRNLDPNPISGLLEQQSYFSDQTTDIENITPPLSSLRLNNNIDLTPIDQTYQNDNFEFRNTPIKFYKTDPITNALLSPLVERARLAPGIYMDLDEGKFLTDIIHAGTANLADNNAFKNYYRGLYFKVTCLLYTSDAADE